MLGQTQDYVNIKNQLQGSFAVSAAAAKSPTLPAGIYDVWCDVDVTIRVAAFARNGVLVASPARAEDVTVANGYAILAKNVVPVVVEEGDQIGAIAGGAGTLRYMKTG